MVLEAILCMKHTWCACYKKTLGQGVVREPAMGNYQPVSLQGVNICMLGFMLYTDFRMCPEGK